MDIFEWTKIIVALAIAVTAALTIKVIGDLAFFKAPAVEASYDVVEDETMPLDLEGVQRDWPNTASGRRNRSTLLNVMRDIENAPVEADAGGAGPSRPAAPEVDFASLLVDADAESGRRAAGQCTACHTFEEGGRHNVGPNLWNVVGREIASADGFANYSEALKAQPGTWTYDALDGFLENPSKSIPGNKMAFLGVRRASVRANIVAYLRSLSASPLPLPEPAAPAAE